MQIGTMQVTWVEVSIVSVVITALIAIIGFFIKSLHSQAMGKFDLLIDNVNKLTTAQALHDERLAVGKQEFRKIEEHQRLQDEKINDLDKRVFKIEGYNSQGN